MHVCISYNSNLRNDVETTMYFLFVKTMGKEIDIQVSMCIAFCWEVTCIVVYSGELGRLCVHTWFVWSAMHLSNIREKRYICIYNER